MEKKTIYAATIVYLSGIADKRPDIKAIGVYKDYDNAVGAAKKYS